jgi:signal transduction histidine kinase
MSNISSKENDVEFRVKEMDRLRKELTEMREELEATTRGTLALYNELDNNNAELNLQKNNVQNQNIKLSKALKDLRESENARILSARTAAIGNIVVTYNHEINNPLAIIFGSIDILKLTDDIGPEDLMENLDKISRAANRIKKVVSKIKEYENLLPKTYINWGMLDLESLENKKD